MEHNNKRDCRNARELRNDDYCMESGVCWPLFRSRGIMTLDDHGLTLESHSEEREWGIGIKLVDVEEQILPVVRETFPDDR